MAKFRPVRASGRKGTNPAKPNAVGCVILLALLFLLLFLAMYYTVKQG